MPSVLNKNQSFELKLYLLRFIEKSFAICGADLNIEVSLIGLLLGFCEHKNISKGLTASSNKVHSKSQNVTLRQEGNGTSHNKQVVHNLVYFSQKILSTLKNKVFPRYSGPKMQLFLEWVNKTLTYLGEN